MYSIVQTFHSYAAYAVLGALLFGTVYAIYALLAGKSDAVFFRKLALFGMIFSHIQLLAGLILYGVSPYGFSNLSGEAMKDATQRLLAVEHPLTNILAIVLITVGYRKLKAASENKLARVYLLYYGFGLVLLLSRVPWSTWLQ
ncbi:MAG: hypothetical protein LW630_10235 [Saprospiraceae bacterium]|nr:hypothetical protein [Saprospiraceae bacterium]